MVSTTKNHKTFEDVEENDGRLIDGAFIFILSLASNFVLFRRGEVNKPLRRAILLNFAYERLLPKFLIDSKSKFGQARGHYRHRR